MLKNTLKDNQISALKSGDQLRLSVLRYILSQIQNIEIEKRKSLDDEEVLALLRKIAKETRESLSAAEKADRQEMAEKLKSELTIITSYLPPELSDTELQKEIKMIISQNETLYKENPKAITGICIKALKGKADPARIIKFLQ